MSQPIEVNCVELMPNTAVGMSRECPDKESTPLQEELLFHEEGTPFGRVLNSFEFRINGEPVVVCADSIPADGSSDLEVVGIIGTIYNKEGLFGQCGWFGNHDLDWFWVRIKGIRALIVDNDPRFRRGEWCVWLHTQLGQYALLLPRGTYREMWEETVAGLGPNGSSAMFRLWPAGGTRPCWWDDRWKDDWPFEKGAAMEQETGSKRRASTETEELEAQARQDDMLASQWKILGSRGEQANQGQMRTNLGQRSQWELSPCGMIPTRLRRFKGSNKKETKQEVKGTPASGSRGRGKSSQQ